MADSNTANYEWVKPELGASEDTWGAKWNDNLDSIDQILRATDAHKASVKESMNTQDQVVILDSEDSDVMKKIAVGVFQAAFVAFGTGTAMLFRQTAAPTGWTKQTDHNNKALRVVSGTVGSGGTRSFTSTFQSRSISGSISNTAAGGSVGGTSLSISQIPSHHHGNGSLTCPSHDHNNGSLSVSNHTHGAGSLSAASHNHGNGGLDVGLATFSGKDFAARGSDGPSAFEAPIVDDLTGSANVGGSTSNSGSLNVSGSTSSDGGQAVGGRTSNSGTLNIGGSTANEGGGNSHNHSFTGANHNHNFTGDAIDMAVQYIDVIVAVKD